MSALDFAAAPPLQRPLRWLLTAPIWGMVGGIWLLYSGAAPLAGRWSPDAAALAHVFALGVLGNAMFGALLQFLPVAAGCPIRLARGADALHLVFNLGIATLLTGLAAGSRPALAWAPMLLAIAPLGFALAALPALAVAGAQRVLRAGIALALCALLATVIAGALAAFVLRGDLALALEKIVDVHAALGLFGWVLILMAAVGSVTLPMFQGAVRIPNRTLAAWLMITALALALAAILRFRLDSQTALIWAIAPSVLAWIGASLWTPLAGRRQRASALAWGWRLGAISLAGGGLTALAVALGELPASASLLAGGLILAVGYPFIVTAMLLEVSAFLCWIELRRVCPRGVRIPGVGLLLPENDRRLALGLHGASACALVIALTWPNPAAARLAGIAVLVAYGASLAVVWRAMHRANTFRTSIDVSPRPPSKDRP